MLTEYNRDELLKHLRGSKREAMTLAFDRAYDLQAEAVRAAEKHLPRNCSTRLHKLYEQRTAAIARVEDQHRKRLAKLFNNESMSSWSWTANQYVSVANLIGDVLNRSVSKAHDSIREKLNAFRDSLGPRHRPNWDNSYRGDIKTPKEKAHILTRKNSAAAKLVAAFTDTLQAEPQAKPEGTEKA
jgi:hypothetical protein